MPLDVIIGAQWGDEGKGRITDLLAANTDIVARYGGGDNAGHTVTVGDNIFKLHLVPSGILHPHTVCLLGNGMVINPAILLDEIDQLISLGVDVTPERLKISSAAHVITPAHLALDRAKEAARKDEKLGTTQRGIGPAYTDKTTRSGLRTGSMRDPEDFAKQVQKQVETAGDQLAHFYNVEPPDPNEAAGRYCQFAKRLKPYLTDVSLVVSQALESGKDVLAEGAQGTLLDLDHGTYPFVTSSYPTLPGALLGLGVGAQYLRRVIGVTKAYQTRVGSGPFPTEVSGGLAEKLRGTGDNPWDEFGTTTGRPRRVGWLDVVLLRYAVRINGFTELALTKLDILSGFDPLHICFHYQAGEDKFLDLPDGPADLSPFTPVYEELAGWESDLQKVSAWDDLPTEAQTYVRRIEALTDLPAHLISIGPERTQIIRRDTQI
jgi:adenylosuccinate synthase